MMLPCMHNSCQKLENTKNSVDAAQRFARHCAVTTKFDLKINFYPLVTNALSSQETIE